MEFNRDQMKQVLIYHWPTPTSGCYCGWGKLGESYADHVVSVYEESMQATDGKPDISAWSWWVRTDGTTVAEHKCSENKTQEIIFTPAVVSIRIAEPIRCPCGEETVLVQDMRKPTPVGTNQHWWYELTNNQVMAAHTCADGTESSWTLAKPTHRLMMPCQTQCAGCKETIYLNETHQRDPQ